MPSRKDVYAVISSERDYQDKRWGVEPRTLSEWIADVRLYADRLGLPGRPVLADFRKIAALCVKAQEEWGVAERGEKDSQDAR